MELQYFLKNGSRMAFFVPDFKQAAAHFNDLKNSLKN